MTDIDLDHNERLSQAYDQLLSAQVFRRACWIDTAQALQDIELVLSFISYGSASTDTDFAEISFPKEDNSTFAAYLVAQDTFHSNLASQLVAFLRRLVIHLATEVEEDEQTELLRWLYHALYLLQGALLLHEPSRTLFTRDANMRLLTDFLDCDYPGQIHMDAIQTLVSALVNRPENLRTFENVGGLKSINKLFLHADTDHSVKVKVLEFLYFYLIPELPVEINGAGEKTADHLGNGGTAQSTIRVRQHSREPAEHSTVSVVTVRGGGRKTTKEKQSLLGQYFSNIDALVRDLNEFKPFGEF